MRSLLTSFCAVSLFFIAGCTASNEPGDPVATTEDEFAAYDAMLEEMQEETASEEAAEAASEGQ